MAGVLGAVMDEVKCKGAQAGLPMLPEASGTTGGGAVSRVARRVGVYGSIF